MKKILKISMAIVMISFLVILIGCKKTGEAYRVYSSQSPTSSYSPSPSPPTQPCRDSDVTPEFPDGRNYYVKGTCKDSRGSYTDNCVGNNLWEFICSSNRCVTSGPPGASYKCPYGCYNGACLSSPINQTNQTGNIYATSYPTLANLYIDNLYQGKTPKTVSVNIGNHWVKITKSGYYDYTTTALVNAGQTTYVHGNLTLIQNQTNSTY